ncbi:respiratory nitrate reductase subunit gamma, partial [Staphylococcus epidermidis]|uniref:respiratory nitrate reductase subunit gamma n=1 Tax=Staphylococcus epidermidis TaxID=1282 RepID=UPI00119CA8A6
MLNQFLSLIYPYLSLPIFLIPHIPTYKYHQFSSTPNSTQIIQNKPLKSPTLLFHLAIIPLFFPHVLALFIPAN